MEKKLAVPDVVLVQYRPRIVNGINEAPSNERIYLDSPRECAAAFNRLMAVGGTWNYIYSAVMPTMVSEAEYSATWEAKMSAIRKELLNVIG
mgnify:CR=1 FL=1